MSQDKLPIKVQGVVFTVNSKGDEEILCLKRSPEDGGFWHIVTGTIDTPHESMFDCLLRELDEELQIQKENVEELTKELHRFLWEKKGVPIWVFTYGVQVKTKDIVLNEEHTEYKWLPLSKAIDLLESDSVKEILNIFSNR